MNSRTKADLIKQITYYLDNPEELNKLKQKGLEWSMKYTQELYAKRLLESINLNIEHKQNIKLYIQAENLKIIKEKWICDILKEEFIENTTLNMRKA